nr:hypothetical protein [Tanacetum cinerariifolium]
MFKIHVMHCEVTWFKEATEFNRIFDELDNAYAKCFVDNQSLYVMNKRNIAKNKCLQIQKNNLLIHDESLIDDCIAKDVSSIVLASKREVLPRSNCRCEELQSTYDREHSRVLELEAEIAEKQQMIAKSKNQNSLIQNQFVDLQVKVQNYKECLRNQKKKQVTFLEPHRTSPRSTQKPPVQYKKPTISVNMFPKAKPATEACKPIPKKNTQNHNPLPAKSVKARRAADYYRNLYVDISQFVDHSTKSVHAKPHQAKRVINTSTNAWNATKNTVTRIVHIWKPTGRRFNLHDIFGSRTSTEPVVKPSELTPC